MAGRSSPRPGSGGRVVKGLVVALALAVLGLTTTACAGSGPAAAPAGVDQGTDEAVVFVALGDDESSGDDDLRASWAQLLYRSAFPRRTVHVNLADRGATVCCDLAPQVEEAIELGATVATVWIGADDDGLATPVASFGTDLESAVRRLREADIRVLLITGNATDGAADGPYAAEIADVAARSDADLVDLSSTDLGGPDGQQRIADAVAEVLGPIR